MGVRSVLHVSREFAGIAEAGGVKDAVSGLAYALAGQGIQTSVALPLYGFIKGSLPIGPAAFRFEIPVPDQEAGNAVRGEPVRVHVLEKNGIRIFLIDSMRFSDKADVYTYTAADEKKNGHKKRGTGHWDFHQMNLILQKAALETALISGEIPDVFHCHDGHSAFLPAIMREDGRISRAFAKTGAVVTIHNAGKGYHQEIWDLPFAGLVTGLSRAVLQKGRIGRTVDPLLLAASYARMATVSEQYARELLAEKDEEVSGGLGRSFRERNLALAGITNGVDPVPFDPRAADSIGLPFSFDPETGDWEGKAGCKKALRGELAMDAGGEEKPLFGFIGRLTRQKGIDVLLGAAASVLEAGLAVDFVVLGQGEARDESLFQALAARRFSRGSFRFIARYDFGLSKRIYAATDFLLIPSEFEPCGLTDFHAQLMGSIPVVHRVGGLVKVRDSETGFSYDEQAPSALEGVIRRCMGLYSAEPQGLERIRRRAFTEIFDRHTWSIVAREGYMPLYESSMPGSRIQA